MSWRARRGSLLGVLMLVVACRAPSAVTTGEGSATPAAASTVDYDELLADLDDPATRSSSLAQLRALAYELAGTDDERPRRAAAAALMPVFAGRWPLAAADERQTALVVATALARVEAEPLWVIALGGDDPTLGGLALEGIAQTGAWTAPLLTALVGRARADLERVSAEGVAEPSGELVRMLERSIELIGHARYGGAVDPLVHALDSRALPISVQRVLVTALGQIGDPRAVDALIAAPFWIPDVASSLSVSERAVRALAAIGEDALPGVLMTLVGNNARVNALAVEFGFDPVVIELSMLSVAGAIGSPHATQPLRERLNASSCGGADPSGGMLSMRGAFTVRALGLIGDPTVVADLCRCSASTRPAILTELVAALGRIGGDQAFACLAGVVDTGSYDPNLVAADEIHSIRWQGFRWAMLAAGPGQLAELRALRARATPEVLAAIDRAGYTTALALLGACGDSQDCYLVALADRSRDSFEREIAAFVLARGAGPGALGLAAQIAAGFATRDPEVRVNMAWLTAKVAAPDRCPVCATILDGVLTQERDTQDATMQAAWIEARRTIDRLR